MITLYDLRSGAELGPVARVRGMSPLPHASGQIEGDGLSHSCSFSWLLGVASQHSGEIRSIRDFRGRVALDTRTGGKVELYGFS